MAKQRHDIKKDVFLCSVLVHQPRASYGPCKVPGIIPPALWLHCLGAPWTSARQGRLAGSGGLGVKLKISLSFCTVSHSSFEPE